MPVDEKSVFQHKSLPAHMIRLLRLKSRAHSPDITCEILHCDRETEYEYFALSYAWGPQEETAGISVDGCRFTVSADLAGALQRLRHDDEDALYWIDQICINQADDEEKSEQVYRMRSVYERASRAMVWLGQSDEDSDLIMVLLETLAELKNGYVTEEDEDVKGEEEDVEEEEEDIEEEEEDAEDEKKDVEKEKEYIKKEERDVKEEEDIKEKEEDEKEEEEDAETDESEYDRAQDYLGGLSTVYILELVVEKLKLLLQREDPILPWDEKRGIARLSAAFENLCGRGYWKRLWIIQELAVAKDVIFCCGSLRLSLHDMGTGWRFFLHAKQSLAPEEGTFRDTWKKTFLAPSLTFLSGVLTRRFRYVNSDPRDPLFNVMCTNLCLQEDYNQVRASDDRDRVFALLGLCRDIDEFDMFPDYSISTAETYEILARRFIEQGYIDTLALCQFPHNLDGDSLPSWVPDWSMYVRMPLVWSFQASALRYQSKPPTILDSKVMTLEGVVVDAIAQLGNTWDPNWVEDIDLDAASQYLKDIWKFRTFSPRLRDSTTLFDCARLATADNPALDHEDWLKIMSRDATTSLISDEQLKAEFCNLIDHERWPPYLKCLHSRRPFMSESGWVGLAASHAEPGDKIVIFLGGRAPYTIRAKDVSKYTVVGETYVHGIMYGEFMTDDALVELFDLV